MSTFACMLSESRLPSFITVYSMYSVVVAVLVCLMCVATSAKPSDQHELSGFGEVYKRQAETNSSPDGEVITPSFGSNTSTDTTTTSTTTSALTNSVPQSSPGLAQDTNPSSQGKLNCSLEANVNKTECLRSHDNDGYFTSLKKQMIDNKEMLLRTLYVTLGITGIIVVYFAARTLWLRNRRTKSRKYRIIAQNGDQRDLEMEPLGDGNDDDEDYTVFELNGRKK